MTAQRPSIPLGRYEPQARLRFARLPVALRLALRELRGGLAGLRTLLACLVLGVAAIAAVGSVRASIEAGLAREAAALLGGDAEIEFTYRFADPRERAWMAANSGAVSEIVDFRSMATMARADGSEARSLVQVKAVDAGYPLVGRFELASGGTLGAALAPHDGLPGLVAHPLLIDRFGLKEGDIVRLGSRDFRLTGAIAREPDSVGAGFAFGPRVVVRLSDLADSGLLAEGAMFDSSYRLRLAADIDPVRLGRQAEASFGESGLQWRDRTEGAPGISRFVDRLGAFLVLLGLAGLAVGGVGVAAAVRAHLETKTGTIATLKTLGASGGTVFGIYLLQIGLLSLLGIVVGVAIGAAVPLLAAPLIAPLLPIPAEFGLYPAPLAEAALYGILTALVFSIWPLARTRDIRAAELFRDLTTARRRWPRLRYVAATLLLAALLVAAATRFSGAEELALTMAAGVVGALVILLAAAAALGRAARALGRGRLTRGRPALRWAFAAVGGPSGETGSVVLSLGLGLSVLAAVGQVDSNLQALVTEDLPERAPAFFFVDIQNDQLAAFRAAAEAEPGVTAVESAPMLRGIITRINDQAAAAVAGGHWALSGDRGVTYAATPPPGTVVTEGNWWPADYAGPPLMSFSAEAGREMGLKLGDRMTLNILGRDLTATISSFRDVRFETMGINFLIALDPAALAGAPHTHIATVYADANAEAPLLKAVGDAWPNITAVPVREAIAEVGRSLEGIGAASRWGAAATLLTGFAVLIGAAAAGERRRVYEAAVLKTLGASRSRILVSFALRAALTGAAAGLVAIMAGAIAGWWVVVYVMEGSFRFEPVSAVAIVVGGALASMAAGLIFALGPLAARPAQVLRARE